MQLKKILQYSSLGVFSFPFLYISGDGSPSDFDASSDKTGTLTIPIPEDTTKKDTSQLPYPFHDNISDPFSNPGFNNSPLYLSNPSNITNTIEYDPDERQYNIDSKMGDLFFRNPNYMTFEEYKESEFENSTKKYWRERSTGEDALERKPLIPKIYVGGEGFDRIFGGNTIDIRPQGSAELTFGMNVQRTDNPQIPEKQRRFSNFDFNEKIQMNVVGNIGEKLKITTSYNTEASFDFENQMKLEYTGYEDEIIRKIEAGNVNLPLTSTLITGSQSLFGIKTQLQFGRLGVTSIFSQQKGQASTVNVPPGGGQLTQFEIPGDQYEANRHFFIGQYFYDNYDNALKNLPVISSQINITKIEVWVTEVTFNSADATRNLVAFQDLGEYNYFANNFIGQQGSVLPSDSLSNDLYRKLTSNYSGIRNYAQVAAVLDPLASQFNFAPQQDYEVMGNAKKLGANDFTYNGQLGYISLNNELRSDQALAVAFEYTVNGKVYRVGELTTGGIDPSQTLIVKLLRGKNYRTNLPTWKLMMKNVYNLGGYGIQSDKFKLDVLYFDNASGNYLRQLPEGSSEPNVFGKNIIRVLNLDNLNSQGDATPYGDGVFDYVENITINSQNGRIIFPEREPFGRYLENKFVNQANADKYTFKELYDSTKTIALAQGKNKFTIKGSYQSSSGSEISLNAINIPQGSVKVYSGGTELQEGTDYTVDYNLGRVKIINGQYLNSANGIRVSLESNSLFSIQSKTLFGSRFDYKISKDITVGGTILHLNERPITQKVNIGDEPISNTIWGLDGTYRTNSRLITKMVDAIPLIDTKEMSSITVSGEFAQFIPGHPKVIGKEGNAYIDDFEGTQSTIELKTPQAWYLASIPRYQPALFPEYDYSVNSKDTVATGYNRAKLAWYNIDPTIFYRNNEPDNITDAELSNHNVRDVNERELFPDRQFASGQIPSIQVLNLVYYPNERGPYNYVKTNVAPGIDGIEPSTGYMKTPQNSWGGIMRRLETNNFEESNIQYIQFWMMDPYNGDAPDNNTGNTGKLYFNLGDISEDILKDGHESYESGIPTTTNTSLNLLNTPWGKYPKEQPTLYAFDRDETTRAQQDIGYDCLNSTDEQSYFTSFLSWINANSPAGAAMLGNDPSGDDFRYFRENTVSDASGSILFRYKGYNGTENNSPVAGSNVIASNTTEPDKEDVNKASYMEVDENYFQYNVDIDPAKMIVGQNYIVDELTANPDLRDNSNKPVKWYLFKIPVNTSNRETFGQISDLKSVKFMRMFIKGFDSTIVLRFARLEFLRGEWRKYDYTLTDEPHVSPDQFDVGAVSLEENASKEPVNYVLPPDIERERSVTSTTEQLLNEQSLSMRLCALEDADMRAAYKNMQLDLRNYKRIKMYAHAEALPDISSNQVPKDNDLFLVVRMGSDFKDNYYELRIPLKITPAGKYDKDNEDDRKIVWPYYNAIDVDLATLTDAKLKRNNAGASLTQLFYAGTFAKPEKANAPNDPNYIFIKGNPTLSEIRVMMIGVRNPGETDSYSKYYLTDDLEPKCAEVWVNEFRMTEFDEKGGWAVLGRVSTKLADFGNLTVTGSHSTHGFGQIESKVSERTKEDITQYDVATSLELGKFLPQSTGITIPMYLSYGEVFSNPQYDPLDPDIEFKRSLAEIADAGARDRRKRIAQDYTRRKSMNFTNVKKNKVGKNATKSHPWDIENFNFTYGFTEIYHRNVSTQYDFQRDYLAAIGYNFSLQPKGLTPFQKWKTKSKYAKPIKDFNINFVPNNFNFRWDVTRHYGETQLRDPLNEDVIIDPTYFKNFLMNRQYGMNWDLTKSIKLEFNAVNQSKIDEPDGKIDTQQERDSIRKNFFKLGRNTDYRQDGSISYNLPLNKLPITDWINVTTRYGFTYHWNASSLSADPFSGQYYLNTALGNTIQNSNTAQVNTSLSMNTLYNKWKLYKKLTAPPKPAPKAKEPKKPDIKAATDTITKDSSKTKGIKPPEKKKEKTISPVVKAVAKVFFGLKSVSLNYTESNGLMLPGFNKQSELLGQNWNSSSSAPGWPFTLGSQDQNIRYKAAGNHWLTTDTLFNQQFTATYTQNITGRATIEPVTGLKIDINASRNYALNSQENFHATNAGEYNAFAHTDGGNFSMSYFSWPTAFIKDRKDYSSSVFENFTNNRIVFSNKLADANRFSSGVDTAGYRDGYGAYSQDVLILSFLSAYSGKSPGAQKTDVFKMLPQVNWSIQFDGLSKIAFMKKIFQNINLTHTYRSTFNVNTFTTDISYIDGGNVRDAVRNFIPKRQIGQVSISEQFSPLIGIDVTWNNNKQKGSSKKASGAPVASGGNLTTRIEFKRDRNVSLALTDIQVTEIKGNELVIGAGYRIPNAKLPIKFLQRIASKRSTDLNLQADFSIRRNNTILRKLVENTSQPTSGLNVISIKTSADYTLNERLNIRLFFDRTITNPVVSTSYPTANTNAGISIRFTLSQ